MRHTPHEPVDLERRPSSGSASRSASRRTLVKGAAWSLPVLATAVSTPLAAASGGGGPVTPSCFDAEFTPLRPANAFPWSSGPLANTDGTFGTVFVAYTSINMTCEVPAGYTYVTYSFEPVISGVVGDPSIAVHTSDQGTFAGYWNPAPGASGTPGATVQVPAPGVRYADPALASANYNAIAVQVVYTNYNWSENPTDLATGPNANHHITGLTVNYIVNVTPYGPTGVGPVSSFPITIEQTLTRPLAGYEPYEHINYLYWYAGYPGTATLTS